MARNLRIRHDQVDCRMVYSAFLLQSARVGEDLVTDFERLIFNWNTLKIMSILDEERLKNATHDARSEISSLIIENVVSRSTSKKRSRSLSPRVLLIRMFIREALIVCSV
jgi:hypothetical protein